MEKLDFGNFDYDKKVNSINIELCLDARKNPISINKFLDKFIEWVEGNNWYISGSVYEYTDEVGMNNGKSRI
jgi:hypothetical protein